MSEKLSGKNNPNYGKRFSEDERKRMSEVQKGKHSGELNYMYGKHHTEEAKLKMSLAKKGKLSNMKGRCHSEEAKRKMSEAKIGTSNLHLKKMVLCVETKNVYASMTNAANNANANRTKISECCNNRRKTAGGYHWKYLYDQTRKDGTIIQGAISLGLITEEEVLKQLEEQKEDIQYDSKGIA